jgi:hypothetical protein
MLWADVSWTERLHGLDSFHRLLAIPLLLTQFRRSNHAIPVVYGFLASSALAVIATYVLNQDATATTPASRHAPNSPL